MNSGQGIEHSEDDPNPINLTTTFLFTVFFFHYPGYILSYDPFELIFWVPLMILFKNF